MPSGIYLRTTRHRKILSENAKHNKGIIKSKRIDYDIWLEKTTKRWQGELNPNWKGGISYEKRYKHYFGATYKKWRMSVFLRDNFTCQFCGLKGIYLTSHHIKSWAKYPELRYNINNGITLCENCHKLTDNYKGRNK